MLGRSAAVTGEPTKLVTDTQIAPRIEEELVDLREQSAALPLVQALHGELGRQVSPEASDKQERRGLIEALMTLQAYDQIRILGRGFGRLRRNVGKLVIGNAAGAAVGSEALRTRLAADRFLSPGALWWVVDWGSAERQYARCLHSRRRPEVPDGWTPERGSVLLIDEIDKADADLPNGLLETLGNGAFAVPYREEAVGLASDAPPPLVVITTNEGRELPRAFVRRCLVLHLELPRTQPALIDWLVARGESHCGKECSERVRRKAAEQLWGDREQALEQALPPPGQAEYLDLLRAVTAMTAGEKKTQRERAQLARLDQIEEFVLKKSAPVP